MKSAVVESVCECQARLYASLDEQRHVTRGWATQRGQELAAPANALGGQGDTLNLGFSCPFCTRNNLRSFRAGALVFREPTPSKAPPASLR
jgi:hypothetical protein